MELGAYRTKAAPRGRRSAMGPCRLAALALALAVAWLATAAAIVVLRPITSHERVNAASTSAQVGAATDEERREIQVLADDFAQRRLTTEYWQERRADKRSAASAHQSTVDPSLRTAHVRAPETGFQAFSTLWGGEPYDPTDEGAIDRSVPAGDVRARTQPAAFRTVCVRLCDGYFYPLSHATTPEHFPKDEQRCESSCASPVRLFFYPNPGGVPEDMEDLDGRAYTALPTAFLYRSSYQRRCTCQPQPWTAEANARHDEYAAAVIVARTGEVAVAAIERVAEAGRAVSGLNLPAGRVNTDDTTEPRQRPETDLMIVPLPVRGPRELASTAGYAEAEPQSTVSKKRRRKRPTSDPAVLSLLPVLNVEPIRRPAQLMTTNEILHRNIIGRY